MGLFFAPAGCGSVERIADAGGENQTRDKMRKRGNSMSSAIIKMKRGSETDLAEVSKSILDDFKGDVAELSLEQMSEVNGVKVLLLILERYYMRNGSMAVSTVQIIDSGEVQQATIIGTGGGEGLMNISLGANQDFARRVAKVLAKLGFEEIRS